MKGKQDLRKALKILGDVLEHRNLHFDLAIVGGAALLLKDLISRSTMDLDAVAVIAEGEKWGSASPLPEDLTTAVREVGRALDLARRPKDEKDWLDSGPSILLRLGLPPGFKERARITRFGGLTLRLASRFDLVHLKLWSATDPARGSRREVDIADLRALKPTDEELRSALAWCAQRDGRNDFVSVNAAPVLRQLGFNVGDLTDDHNSTSNE